MSEEIPIWRQAIQDKTHPLHQAAWLLFSEGWSGKLADRLPAENRDRIIEFCYLLIDTDELYLSRALGKGLAPSNAIQLLGHWQVTDAIPIILEAMNEESDEPIFLAAVPALGNMGAAVIEPVLEYAAELEDDDDDTHIDITEILVLAGKGDDRAFDYIQHFFESRPPADSMLTLLAQKLLRCNPDRAFPYLEAALKQNRYKRWRKSFEESMTKMRNGEL